MRETLVVWAVVAAVVPFIPIAAQSQNSLFRVALLGTGTPNPSPERLGPGTLVEAGVEKLTFDVGRGVVIRLEQLGIPYAAITGIWLLPTLGSCFRSPRLVAHRTVRSWTTAPRNSGGRVGTGRHRLDGDPLTEAFQFDLGIRKALKPSQGLLTPHEIHEGRVFARNGVDRFRLSCRSR